MQLVRPLWLLFLMAIGLTVYGATKQIAWSWITGTVLQQLGSLLAVLLLRAIMDLSPESSGGWAPWLTAVLAGWLLPSLLQFLLAWGLLYNKPFAWSIPLLVIGLFLAPLLLRKIF